MVGTCNEPALAAAAASEISPPAIDICRLVPARTPGATPLARRNVPAVAHRSREPVAV
jgi:hypothetical protein